MYLTRRLKPYAWAACLVLALVSLAPASGQTSSAPAAPILHDHGPMPLAPHRATDTPPLGDTGCCGPVTAAGRHLRQVLDGMDVEHLWQNHVHIDWETGKPDRGATYEGADMHTHCSAFAAAVGERVGVYMLRPPDHPQQLLASAQGQWFAGKQAQEQGWSAVGTARQAQSLANQGELVVIVYVSPDASRPGHIAVVRPAMKTDEALKIDGPETIQAGGTNFAQGTARRSFALHAGAWPDGVKIYAHATSFANGPAVQTGP